jgi:hypothetical protein
MCITLIEVLRTLNRSKSAFSIESVFLTEVILFSVDSRRAMNLYRTHNGRAFSE